MLDLNEALIISKLSKEKKSELENRIKYAQESADQNEALMKKAGCINNILKY